MSHRNQISVALTQSISSVTCSSKQGSPLNYVQNRSQIQNNKLKIYIFLSYFNVTANVIKRRKKGTYGLKTTIRLISTNRGLFQFFLIFF